MQLGHKNIQNFLACTCQTAHITGDPNFSHFTLLVQALSPTCDDYVILCKEYLKQYTFLE